MYDYAEAYETREVRSRFGSADFYLCAHPHRSLLPYSMICTDMFKREATVSSETRGTPRSDDVVEVQQYPTKLTVVRVDTERKDVRIRKEER